MDSLTGLRFVAALLVFSRHVTWALDRGQLRMVSDWGAHQGIAGVSFFFILSGFILTVSRRPDDTSRRFYRRRFARVWPNQLATFVVALLVIVWVERGPISVPGAMANLVLVQAWCPRPDVYLGMNGVTWTLSCEAFFYALFPLLVVLLGRLDRRGHFRVLGLMAVGALLAPYSAAVIFHGNDPVKAWFSYAFPAVRLIEFIIGIVLGLLLTRDHVPRIPLRPAVVLAAVGYIAASVPGRYAGSLLPGALANVAVTLVPFAILVVAVAQADIARERSAFASGALVRLGEWSFAFYLTHYLVIRVLQPRVQDHIHSPLAAIAVILISLAISILAAAALFTLVERPAERRLRRDTPRLMLATDDIALDN